jgi:outer membrane receptor protein involved in Fe transport
MPFVPEFQFTSIGRYNLDFGRFPGYLQAAISYTGASWNFLEIEDRLRQDAYTLLNLSAGIENENWSLDLFINNATDERAQLTVNEPSYGGIIDTTTVTNRPRTIGIRFGQRFN